MNKLFIDTETTGLPKMKGFNKYYSPSLLNYYDNARIIEIGYVIFSNDNIKIKEVNVLIKPDNFIISNTPIHGITTEEAINKGTDIKIVLLELEKDLENVDTIIAHNISFDINIIFSECYRIKNTNLIEKFKLKNYICTMKLGQSFMKCKKYPKLIELHKYLFNNDIVQNHRALSDVIICYECYFEINKNLSK